MPRSPKDNQLIRESRREAILLASAKLFAERGYAHTKISDIARATGQSHGLVYHYFTNKDAIFEAIVEQAMTEVLSDLANPGQGKAIARLERIVDNALDRVSRAPEVGVLLSQVLLLGSIPPKVRELMRGYATRLHDEWVSIITDAQRDGDVTTEASAEELAGMFLCSIRGLAIIAHAKSVDHDATFQFEVPSRAVFMRFLRA